MMTKLGYSIQEDRTVSVAIVREALFINRQYASESSTARQIFENEMTAVRERHRIRVGEEFRAHQQRLADSANLTEWRQQMARSIPDSPDQNSS